MAEMKAHKSHRSNYSIYKQSTIMSILRVWIKYKQERNFKSVYLNLHLKMFVMAVKRSKQIMKQNERSKCPENTQNTGIMRKIRLAIRRS